ncbi:MAG: Sec-independent protein translocase protein TatB [Paracoccus sp. (in: a-proteobacteria)]|uniref:Sec-independent protein translocase protein TatB n=1 Tax=Paracoccus sp. TaxID=267 RepID=UPI0026DEAAA2|nr:Sec-independent protein translocase protein TatB [Paracoccus sp. (in: a-proteobacteria)]MDO5611722.1 Sec-independent protein translocase protein TatB [Paracoccus sp. (in: a-proteobacteria)]
MLDIGWSELLVIGVVALIVIGPEDLPRLFRSLGRFTAKARGMAREFSQAMDDAAKTSGLDDAASTLRDVKNITSKKNLGLDALDRAADRFEKWDPKVSATRAARPDPAAPSPTGTVVPTADLPDPAPASDPAPAPAPTPAPAPAPQAAPGTRRLRAIRRSDLNEG